MKEYYVKNFEQLHKCLLQYRQKKVWIFRGHANKDWSLVPKIGRSPYSGVDEIQIFESWKRRAIEYLNISPESDWDWLAIAQHHGLVTRLLDWSTNPLFAAFFAVKNTYKGQAMIFVARIPYDPKIQQTSPFDINGVKIFYPKSVVPRITRQGGLFTIHGNPTESPEEGIKDITELHKIYIEESYRNTLRSELSFYGINEATLFPDLDGLASFINWTIEAKEYWNSASYE
jgi:hypothetical protein